MSIRVDILLAVAQMLGVTIKVADDNRIGLVPDVPTVTAKPDIVPLPVVVVPRKKPRKSRSRT